MTTSAPLPLVSVTLPCYRQLDVARRAIESILAQTYSNLEVTLLDDGASDDYREYVESLADPRVQYERNRERLGAMKNMFAAISAGRGEYAMAFHEDDLLSSGYVAAAVGILQTNASCGFVACQLNEFVQDPPSALLNQDMPHPAYEKFATSADLVRGILRGTADPMFGSVMYRRAAVAGVVPDHLHYATLVDRPFLLSIVERGWTAAVIREPMVWYRHHQRAGDTRHMAMAAEHILQLLETYRSKLPARLTKEDRALFFSFSGYWLFELYRLTPPDRRPAVWTFLFRAWRKGLYDPRARGRFGLRQIQRALLNQTSVF
ncbi:MAG TPA: glycosyltransferase family 2 protein [Vicinamibacterales bacterium]|nr:glycosyltransferase family 2 protein [Vicinamibacterales bacterium]